MRLIATQLQVCRLIGKCLPVYYKTHIILKLPVLNGYTR
jgi:hypothetical protein